MMSLIDWFRGEASRELADVSKSKGWVFDDLIWAINLAICSKTLETKEDVLDLCQLLVELNPYLLAESLHLLGDSLPEAYGNKAVKFLKASSRIKDDNDLDEYKTNLHKLLRLRVEFVSKHKPYLVEG